MTTKYNHRFSSKSTYSTGRKRKSQKNKKKIRVKVSLRTLVVLFKLKSTIYRKLNIIL